MKDDPRSAGCPSPRHCVTASPGQSKRSALLAGLLALAGCGTQPQIMEYNYLTYDHSFTDAAVADVKSNAERECGRRGQVAIMSNRACSLTRCTTSYQCGEADITLPAEQKR